VELFFVLSIPSDLQILQLRVIYAFNVITFPFSPTPPQKKKSRPREDSFGYHVFLRSSSKYLQNALNKQKNSTKFASGTGMLDLYVNV
jgi:hypothetical protein